MRNQTGKPYAFKALAEDGYWEIYFDPSPKLDGYFYYETIRGPVDVSNADLIVGLLLSHKLTDDQIHGITQKTEEK